MFAEAATDENTLFDRNMAAFERWAPRVHARLSAIEKPHSALVARPDGGIDMMLGGTYFYDDDAVAFTERQLEAYFKGPDRRFFVEPDPEMLRGIAGEFCRRLRSEISRQSIQLAASPRDRAGFYTVMFGIGLGLHVSQVMTFTQCRLLVLIEPNIENLLHSLSVVEWDALFEQAAATECEIAFITEAQVDVILIQTRNAIRARNPGLIDGMYFYTHYYSSILERARQSFSDDLVLLIVGLGFLEDEFKMTANAASNIARRPVRVLADPLPAREEPLLIIGSGPSVDKDMEAITRLADKAAVMSVGTGLRGLLDHDIRPDYHVEVENGIENADFVHVVREEFGLKDVTLVGSVTTHPTLRELFDDSVLFFRERSSSTMLFAEGRSVVQPSGPTVANAAVSAAVRMGFRELYFFGLDMGSKAGAQYHSKHSVYGAGHFDEPVTETRLVMPGNFGGEASAESVLFWSRYMLESFLRLHPQIACFNCSDGARITGAVPKVSRTVHPTGPVIDRAGLKEAIRRRLPIIDDAWRQRCWDKQTHVADAADVIRTLRSIMARAKNDKEIGRDWMARIVDAVRYEVGETPAVRSYFFGSFVLILGAFWWYDKRVSSPEEQQRFRRIALTLIESAIDYAERVVLRLLDEVDSVLDRDIDIIQVQLESQSLIE